MPKPSPPALRLSLPQARAAILAAQGLAGDRLGSLREALHEAGFVRTLGGVDVYLALRARVRDLTRAQVDAAVAAGEAAVTPAVRGCIYLVSARDQPACLALAARLSETRDRRDQERAAVRPGEVEELARAVLATLAERGALSTGDLRRALPQGAVRSLGEQGKKVGLSSPLPPALRQLEFRGEIERTLEGGRLDSERYLWRQRARSPWSDAPLPRDAEELHARFAAIFLRAAGIGSRRVFAEWAGLGQREAQAALQRLDTIPVQVEGIADEQLASSDLRDLLADPPAVKTPAFLPFEDNTVALHGGPALLVDPAHHELEAPSWGRSTPATLGTARHASLRSVATARGIDAFWEYDPDDGGAVVVAPLAGKLPAAVAAAARQTASFVRDELGHGKSFSLDDDDALRQRAAGLLQRPGAARLA